MQNPWKIAGLAILALGAIVGTSTLTTAYLLRPPVGQPESPESTLPPAPEPRAPLVRVAPPSTSRPVARVAAAQRVPPPAAVTPAAPSTAAAPDCDTGGERAARIAKPGALGAVLGAGLGAAGGAVANGGKGAGQGALIGGLAGAAMGAGYGAYRTQTECGTIFGESAGSTAPAQVGRSQVLEAR
jgi:hypothetical protein